MSANRNALALVAADLEVVAADLVVVAKRLQASGSPKSWTLTKTEEALRSGRCVLSLARRALDHAGTPPGTEIPR